MKPPKKFVAYGPGFSGDYDTVTEAWAVAGRHVVGHVYVDVADFESVQKQLAIKHDQIAGLRKDCQQQLAAARSELELLSLRHNALIVATNAVTKEHDFITEDHCNKCMIKSLEAYLHSVRQEVAELSLSKDAEYLKELNEQNTRLRARVEELTDTVCDVVIQSCSTSEDALDSMATSAYADALRLLAKLGVVEIVEDRGRRVIAKKLLQANGGRSNRRMEQEDTK